MVSSVPLWEPQFSEGSLPAELRITAEQQQNLFKFIWHKQALGVVTLLFKDEGQDYEDLVDLLNTTAWVMSPEIAAVSCKVPKLQQLFCRDICFSST